jgi:hypothetical protein
MARKLKLVKGAAHRGALVYGIRIFQPGEVFQIDDATVKLNDGESRRITMHLIEGTRVQMRRQLMQSIDAYFELLEEGL